MNKNNLFEKRLLFITGKGGVGKTTISGALALAATGLGKKVLLVDVGGDDSLARLFKANSIEHIPAEVHPQIDAVRVDPKETVEEYVHTFVKSKMVADRITRSAFFDHLVAATPGMREIMTMGKIWMWESARHDDTGEYVYDLILVDAPATGHGLSFLQTPQVLRDMIAVGPIREQTEKVQALLRDRQRTMLNIVTLPEDLPVSETLQLYSAATQQLRMLVGCVFINGVYPKLFTLREAAEVKRLLRTFRHDAVSGNGDYRLPLLQSARVQIGRRTQQEFYMKKLKDQIKADFVEIPYLFTAGMDLETLQTMAAELSRSVA
jgi:anion-transporting  ArsA/GET3 family ATPase